MQAKIKQYSDLCRIVSNMAVLDVGNKPLTKYICLSMQQVVHYRGEYTPIYNPYIHHQLVETHKQIQTTACRKQLDTLHRLLTTILTNPINNGRC